MKRAVALNAAQPAGQVGDLFDVVRLAGMKGHFPVVAADVTVGVALGFKPRVAQQDADGIVRLDFPQPVKNHSRAGLGKMVERDVQRVVGRRREPGLEATAETAGRGALPFHTEVFLKNPGEFGREAALGQDLSPSEERFSDGRSGELGF